MNNIDEDIKLLESFNAGDEYTEKIKQAIENVSSELKKQDEINHVLQSQLDVANAEKIEWKKIAEKLARTIRQADKGAENLGYYGEFANAMTKDIIDWARKEVEKDES